MSELSLKRRFGGYVLEAQSALRALGKPKKTSDKRFVLFGRGRSGSTLLVQMLDSNPAIGCLDELLRFKTLNPIGMIERELGQLSYPVQGFKLLSYQVRDLHSRHAIPLRDWMADPNVTIFHLRRENVLRHALSNIYAKSRKAYHSTDSAVHSRPRITVSQDVLFHWMQGSLDLLDWETNYLGDLDREVISYERDLSNPTAQAATVERVSASLGATATPSQAQLKKVTPQDYNSFIENWADLKEAIADSKFRDYLELPG